MPTDTSAVFGLRAPTLGDPEALGGQRLRQLRDDVESVLVGTVMADSGATGAAAAGFAAAPNFNLTTGDVRRRRGLVCVDLTLQTVNALTATDFANINAVTVPVGWRPLVRQPVLSIVSGGGVFAYVSGANIVLTSSTAAFAAGAALTLAGMWMV